MKLFAARTVVFAVVSAAAVAEAQEFRVYTRVFDLNAKLDHPAKVEGPPIISRSLSLFRAGKVYDYVDSVSEVIIFEPSQRRFSLLNTASESATTLDFEELKQLLKEARFEAERYLATRTDAPAVDVLQVQLTPEFKESVVADQHLILQHPEWKYFAKCSSVDSPENLDAFLRYADWIARLNYALHPQALFPEPRLELNARLRRRQWLPMQVELQTSANGGIHLRAEHQMHWELDANDRKLIHRWETLLKSKQTKWISFHEYRQAILAEAARAR